MKKSLNVPGVISHLVNTRVREVGENIGKVESSHGQLRDDHLGECREGTEPMSTESIDRRAKTHLKTPYRSALKAPKPAAAEKLPRSMIPLEIKTLFRLEQAS
jgi:hypothetical protein